MYSIPTESAGEFTSSDVLSSNAWSGRTPPAALGIDVACTKIAVDLQNMQRATADTVLERVLQSLVDLTGCDCAFTAFITPEKKFGEIKAARRGLNHCQPELLYGEPLSGCPGLSARLEHLRLTELRDTAHPEPKFTADSMRFADLYVGSALLIAFQIHGQPAGILGLVRSLPRGAWDVNLRLLLKLVGASLATGLANLRMERRLAKVEERLAMSQAAANDGVWDFDLENNEVYFSPRWKAMLGYADEELRESPDWRSLVHPDDITRVQDSIRDHVAGKLPVFESVHRMRHRNGDWRWVISRAQARTDAHGRLLRLVGVELDITERKLYEEALFREKESAQVTLQSIGDGVITTNAQSLIDYINPVAEALSGWRLEDAMGRPVEEVFRVFHEETSEPLENPLAVAIQRMRSIKSARPMLLIRRDGNELYVESTAAPIRDGGGMVGGGVLVFHDVSESRELNRRLSYHTSHDLLTGLVNRGEFEVRLDRAIKSAKAHETSYAVCHLDIDQFKIINEGCGHGAGDALLRQVGMLLKAKIRWRDTLSRLSGDEFGILLESCSLDEAMHVADQLREAVRTSRFSWNDRVFRLGASVGVVPITVESKEVTAVLSTAASACQAAKDAGRNRVHSFAENDIDFMRRRHEMQWATRINAALEEGRFEIHRMAIAPLQRADFGQHYELLVRMRDENGVMVPPGNFIAAAERYGIAPSIDRWVLENALRWLVSEADEREKLELCSINLSGQSLSDDKFLPFVIDRFRQSGVDATKICFEITETTAVSNYSQASNFIKSLKDLGCKFALDDFGAGLSSFGYLKHFPVDYLKIDGSFVREILRDPIDREMVRSINEIGHLTGKQTIAEYAENEEVIQMLRSLGLDYAQGWGVAQPQCIVKATGS